METILLILLFSCMFMVIFYLVYKIGVQEGENRVKRSQSERNFKLEYIPSMGLSKNKSYEQAKRKNNN